MNPHPQKKGDRETRGGGVEGGRERVASCSQYSPQGKVRINLLRDYPSYTMFSVLPIVCLFKHN